MPALTVALLHARSLSQQTFPRAPSSVPYLTPPPLRFLPASLLSLLTSSRSSPSQRVFRLTSMPPSSCALPPLVMASTTTTAAPAPPSSLRIRSPMPAKFTQTTSDSLSLSLSPSKLLRREPTFFSPPPSSALCQAPLTLTDLSKLPGLLPRYRKNTANEPGMSGKSKKQPASGCPE
eukprot:2506796-Rhodomonas_salina.1